MTATATADIRPISSEDTRDLSGLAPRIRDSDAEAFAVVFDRLNRPLVRYAQRFTSDVPTAYDILQDVFAALWQKRETLADDSNLQALLYTMVRNSALNIRRKSSRIVDTDVVAAQEARASAPSPESAFENISLQRRIERWIRDLPPRRAEAFMLSRYHGLRHGEIAEVMGLSERTVQTHILLAVRELRVRLEKLNE